MPELMISALQMPMNWSEALWHYKCRWTEGNAGTGKSTLVREMIRLLREKELSIIFVCIWLFLAKIAYFCMAL